MSESTRPSMQSVQKTLIIGILVGLLLGCIVGSGIGLYWAWMVNPAIYSDGAYPSELTTNYQDHYLVMVIDSYAVNRQLPLAQERLKNFDQATKISALGKWAAFYGVNGRAVEAQGAKDLAGALKQAENWDPNIIAATMSQLAAEAQSDPARLQAINDYGASLNVVPAGQPTVPPAEPPAGQPISPVPTPTAAEESGGMSWLMLLGVCFLVMLILVAIVLLVGRIYQGRKKAKPAVVWEGEGPAPLKHWSGTYALGQDNYDEFFTIETDSGDFLGESGMGILETVPGSSPKQVKAFDVGLFDKTDITTLSRVVMSEQAYNDSALRSKIEANPQAEAILAEPGKQFTLETSAMRVVAKIEELEYGPGNEFFNKLKMSLDVFVREGADLKIGTMDIPDQFK